MIQEKTYSKPLTYMALIFANMIYACVTFCTKNASLQTFLSFKYLLFMAGAVMILGVYAVIWQQIIKKVPIAEAYMFKGTTLIFILILSALFFGETITLDNIIGAALIVGGIVFFARS